MHRAAFAFLLLAAGATARSAPLTSAEVDRMMVAEWHRARVVPARSADDTRFLRRAYLDIVGIIPTADAVRSFLADRAPDKRARAVDALLAMPRYADHWTDYWDDVLMGRQVRAAVVDRASFREWLHDELARAVPWDRFVTDLLTATGRNSPGGAYARAAGFDAPADAERADDSPVNGAVNWMLKYAQTPADLSGAASRIFLGVQIQCAQCHDHKTEKWTQQDFRRFTACFAEVRPVPVDRGKVRGVRRIDVRDARRPLLARRARPGAEYLTAEPAALDGTDFSASPNRRRALAAWVTAHGNPWFARAYVNRMWAHFLGRGFADPADDFRESNPPAMAGVLDRIARDFAEGGYDPKRLIRLICGTRAYQLSSGPARAGDPENHLWSRYRLKPMRPEALVDSLVQATNLRPVLERVAGANLDRLHFLLRRQFEFLFDVDEETDRPSYEGTIPQALLLLNGNLTNRATTAIPGTALAEVLAMDGGDAARVEELYLRTLSRPPTPSESRRWTDWLAGFPSDAMPGTASDRAPTERARGRPPARARGAAQDPLARVGARLAARDSGPHARACADLFWALLNSSEFAFNH